MKIIKNNGLLPKKMGIDEFNATKDAICNLAFIIVNQDKKTFLILIIADSLMIYREKIM